jgi:hypothetical protein
MRRSLFVVAVAVAIMAAWSLGPRMQGQKTHEKVLFVSSANADYKSIHPGVSEAAI